MPEEFIITKDGDKDVKNTNPTHENWVALDQQVISFLLSSIKRVFLQQVSTCKSMWLLHGTPSSTPSFL
jgi:hypothetical protein